MAPDPPPPPSGEPTKRDVPPAPAVASGAIFRTALDWYEKNANKKSIFEGDYYKTVKGLYITGVLSATTKITLGWEHKNVLGGTATMVMPVDNKINVGFVLNYIFPLKDEHTCGNKSEFILGCKISHVRGDKTKFVGADEINVDDIERAKKLQTENLHALAEKLLAGAIEEQLKSVDEDHALAERTIGNHEVKYKSLEMDVKTAELRSSKLKEMSKDCREEIDNMAGKYSGTFKSLASAAHEINCNGALDLTSNGDAKLVSDGLVAIGAALTKAG